MKVWVSEWLSFTAFLEQRTARSIWRYEQFKIDNDDIKDGEKIFNTHDSSHPYNKNN